MGGKGRVGQKILQKNNTAVYIWHESRKRIFGGFRLERN